MIRNNNKKLNPFKKVKLEDLFSYARTNKKIISYDFLRKNGYDPEDIDIIYNDYELDIIKLNYRILESKYNILVRELQSKNYNNKNKSSVITKNKIIKSNEYIECDDHWKFKSYGNGGVKVRKVFKSDIDSLLEIINNNTDKHNKYVSYQELVSNIIIKNKLFNITVDSFNGGRNRKYYFNLLYFPIKVLQHLKLIKYNNRKLERL